MKSKISKILLLLLSTSLLLMGCQNASNNNSEDDNTLNIVTSFYPMYISTLNIVKGIDNIKLTNMTQPQTGCLHDYTLSPSDLKKLEKADILVVNGAGMEAFLSDIIDQYPDLKIVTASEGLDLLADDEHDHEDEHDNETAEEHAEHADEADDHDHEYNAHLWVSVLGNIEEVKNITSQLSTLDPEHKTQYEANADEYISKLEALSAEMHSELDSLSNRNIITFHEAFPYFAKEFNLNIAGVIQIDADSEPSARDIEEVIKTIKEQHITALFTEPQYFSDIASTIANETGAKVYELDPIVTGEANEDSYDDYINKMKQNLETLKEALK